MSDNATGTTEDGNTSDANATGATPEPSPEDLAREEKRNQDKQEYLAKLVEENKDYDREITRYRESLKQKATTLESTQQPAAAPMPHETVPAQPASVMSTDLAQQFVQGLSSEDPNIQQQTLNKTFEHYLAQKEGEMEAKMAARVESEIQRRAIQEDTQRRYSQVNEALMAVDPTGDLAQAANGALMRHSESGFNPTPEQIELEARFGDAGRIKALAELGLESLRSQQGGGQQQQQQVNHPMGIGSSMPMPPSGVPAGQMQTQNRMSYSALMKQGKS